MLKNVCHVAFSEIHAGGCSTLNLKKCELKGTVSLPHLSICLSKYDRSSFKDYDYDIDDYAWYFFIFLFVHRCCVHKLVGKGPEINGF